MAPEVHPDVCMGQEKVSNDYLTLPNNVSFMKYAPKSGPGLVDVGVLHSIEEGKGWISGVLGQKEKTNLCHVDQHEN